MAHNILIKNITIERIHQQKNNKFVYNHEYATLLVNRVSAIVENETLKKNDCFELTAVSIEKYILDEYLSKNSNKKTLFNVILFLQKHATDKTLWIAHYCGDFFLFGDIKKNLLLAKDIAELWKAGKIHITALEMYFEQLYRIHQKRTDVLIELLELFTAALLARPSVNNAKGNIDLTSALIKRCQRNFSVRAKAVRAIATHLLEVNIKLKNENMKKMYSTQHA